MLVGSAGGAGKNETIYPDDCKTVSEAHTHIGKDRGIASAFAAKKLCSFSLFPGLHGSTFSMQQPHL